MIFIQFILLVIIVVIGSSLLSRQAEIIDTNSKLSPALIGILLAFATSLPELVTGLTSTFLGQPEMSIGNILGSNSFNFLIISFFNIIFFKKVVIPNVEDDAKKLNVFTMLMYALFLLAYFGITFNTSVEILGRLSLGSIGILVLYIFAVRISSNIEIEVEVETKKDKKQFKVAIIKFAILAIVILITSIFLARTADKIVTITGLDPAYVGAIFIGISTSLPELTTCYNLVKTNNFTMAATSIWGSNLFNFAILSIVDIFSSEALLTKISPTLFGLAIIGLLFSIVHYFQTGISPKYKKINVFLSIFMIVIYIAFFLS